MTSALRATVDHHPMSDTAATALLERLVRTPSVSGSEDAAVRAFVETAAASGLACEIDEAGNGIARRGNAAATKRIALLGHIDTVPGEIPVRIEHGVLHGRGSVDAKGPLAAMLSAATRASVSGNVAIDVIAAVGEEADSLGARFVRDRIQPDACIIGEPSGWDGVTLGYKGCLRVRARCERPAAHSAGPDPSAADTLHAWWTSVRARIEELSGNATGAFERIQATILSMGTARDGLVETGVLEAGFRLPVSIGPDELAAALRALAGDAIEIECRSGERACRSDRNDAVVRALAGGVRSVGGKPRMKVKTGTADFNVVAPVWACPIAAYGPGDSSLDHTPEERLSIDEYLRSVRVLVHAIEALAHELIGEPS